MINRLIIIPRDWKQLEQVHRILKKRSKRERYVGSVRYRKPRSINDYGQRARYGEIYPKEENPEEKCRSDKWSNRLINYNSNVYRVSRFNLLSRINVLYNNCCQRFETSCPSHRILGEIKRQRVASRRSKSGSIILDKHVSSISKASIELDNHYRY